MGREESMSRRFNKSASDVKESIIENLTYTDTFQLERAITVDNGYTLLIDAKRSIYSNKGEKIVVNIQSINEEQTLVTVTSTLKAKLQQFDSGKNKKNIK